MPAGGPAQVLVREAPAREGGCGGGAGGGEAEDGVGPEGREQVGVEGAAELAARGAARGGGEVAPEGLGGGGVVVAAEDEEAARDEDGDGAVGGAARRRRRARVRLGGEGAGMGARLWCNAMFCATGEIRWCADECQMNISGWKHTNEGGVLWYSEQVGADLV